MGTDRGPAGLGPANPGQADLGIVGLGVMGRSLAANLADHGFRVAGLDLDPDRREAFAADSPGAIPCADPGALVAALKRPRAVLLMVPAGAPVDAAVADLVPHLAPGDLILDGGNSHYADTVRRAAAAKAAGLDFVGLGVSGGEEGARHGPALMAGGTAEAIGRVSPMLSAIAARAEGEPCFGRVGPDGAGHFVKTIHNGIEYADMQLIAEAYFVLRRLGGMSHERLAETFAAWNRGELGSYLLEITADILRRRDPETGLPMLDVIMDAAGQKGTGHWAATAALELGMPAPTIAEAVHARCLSALKAERVRAAAALGGRTGEDAPSPFPDPDALTRDVHDALLCGHVATYAQGFAVMQAAARLHGWDMDLGAVASIWRAGCIIRARLIDRILVALRRDPRLPNLLLDPTIGGLVASAEPGWRRALARATEAGVPVPCTASALAYWDGYRTERLWANVIQAQRDYFGAHGYRRVDRPDEPAHTDWGRLP
jgi:6-phosphogluconate dehydrogenase